MPREPAPTPPVSLDTPVRIPDSVLFQELSGEMVLLNLERGTYFGLDPMGTRIWQLLRESGSLQRVLARLLEEFDVEEARCRDDVLQLVAELQAHGLVDVRPTESSLTP